jgi:TolB-like protein/tRNA A-37 threonylcarbamoyl transferase component Bud32
MAHEPLHDAATPAIGELFAGRYRIEALLRRGRSNFVYRAHDAAVNEVVALELHEALDGDALAQFRQQARLARRVTHRNVARTYDIGEHAGLRYLTTEYIEGVNLHDWKQRQPSTTEVIDVAMQLAAGLAAMHAAEVIHRDLQPSKIVIESGGRTVITELDIECSKDRQIDEYSDLHALGAIVVELFSGALPDALLEPLQRPFASASEFADALGQARTQLAAELDTEPVPSSRRMPQAKALAVLPFRYRGPASESFVADALLDELTDSLSMTRGLQVFGGGATARFSKASDRDPRVLGSELGVDVVVDGSIQLAGQRLRIAARLLDVHSGFQLWSERFDGELHDVFDLQDKLGQRIAEALRVELELVNHGGLTDPEALESYLRARQAKLHWRLRGPDGAIVHYRRVLERVPDFRPAIAGLAVVLIRGWFMPSEPNEEPMDWPNVTAAAVARAMAEAPDFPESQVAAAQLSVQTGDYRAAAEHLREALRIAPTCSIAHEYLGRLQMEAAQPEKGLRHLTLALELDPQLEWCHVDIARQRALEGDVASFQEHIGRTFARYEGMRTAVRLYEMRVGAWTRDLDMVRRALAHIDGNSEIDAVRIMHAYGPALLEPYDGEALAGFHAYATKNLQNGRLLTLVYQLWSEQTAFWSDRERTLAHLEAAVDLALVDLAWLDGCPLFDFLREEPRFIEVRSRVRARCEAIWAST